MQINVEHVLAIIGAVVPLVSALASILNNVVRMKQMEGKEVPKALLTAGVVLNTVAINLDKASVLAKAVKGKPLVSGSVAKAKAEAPKSE
jgi:hypothetical protein